MVREMDSSGEKWNKRLSRGDSRLENRDNGVSKREQRLNKTAERKMTGSISQTE